jgi:hemerythrin-like metal-binding protein
MPILRPTTVETIRKIATVPMTYDKRNLLQILIEEIMANLADSRRLFESGNRVIDQQHRQLLALCNDAALAIAQFATNPGEFFRILNDVADLMHVHFRTEEDILRKNAYPNLDDHIKKHNELELEMTDLLWDACVKEGDAYRVRFEKFLSVWLDHHLFEIDAPAQAWFKSQQ